jgi:hypothetical protein
MQGLYLAPGARSDLITISAAATEQMREAILARYGTFRVVIAHDPDVIRSQLSDLTTGVPLQPDARGIYWSYDPGLLGIGASWWALTRYANVIAGWSAGGVQRTVESWGRMTAELERLPTP